MNRYISALIIFFVAACSPKSSWVNYSPYKQEVFEKQFELSPSEITVRQQRYDENIVSAFFRVTKDGKSVNGLTASELQVQENGVAVPQFQLGAETEKIQQTADIIFLVDITGTMVELIETAKKRLAEFVADSRKRGYRTRMCISTFGDFTVKKCSRFFDNNPSDKSTEAQVKELLSELAQLRAFRGNGKDPGWPDLDENPMGALIDASKAPWGADSQRFVILVTDWGFLYSPDNQGTIGTNAPTMKQVTEAIKASQMKVFAVTRTEHNHKGEALKWDGYNTPFQGEPGIVQSSDGEHFAFDKVLAGEITLTSILERILSRLNTTYKITYVVDKVPGLTPSLTVDKRKVVIQTKDASKGQAQVQSVLSSMPKGRPEYQRKWKIADEPVVANSAKVYIEGRELKPSEFAIQNQEVIFSETPAPGVNIRFVFYHENTQKHLRLEPILFPQPVDEARTVVFFNGIEAQKDDYALANTLEGHTTLTLTEGALHVSDPYKIRENRGLKIRVLVACGGKKREGLMKKSDVGSVECVK